MNYINNHSEMCCCSLNEQDIIRFEKRTVLFDMESGKPIDYRETPEVGRTYRCAEAWALIKGYIPLEYYPSEELAREAYDRLVKQLGLTGIVINLE